MNLAYPVLDAVALAAVFFVALRRRLNPPAGLNLLALGIILWTLADSSWWYMIEVDPSLPSVTPFETGWVAGFVLVAFAASRTHRPRTWTTRPVDSKFVLSLPALPGLGGVLIVLSGWLIRGHVESSNVLLAIMGVFMVLVLALLVIVTYENHALTSDLERRVDERTAELHQTERYYRALVEHSSDLVMVLDADLKIRYVSDSCERLFGFTQEQLTGRGLDVFGGEAPAALTDALERLGSGYEKLGARRMEADRYDRPHAVRRVDDQQPPRRPGCWRIRASTRATTPTGWRSPTSCRASSSMTPSPACPTERCSGDRASQAFARSRRTGDAVAIMAIDLDAFKLVNDGFGHSVGDLLLCGVAERLVATRAPRGHCRQARRRRVRGAHGPRSRREQPLWRLPSASAQALAEGLNVEGANHRVAASIGVAIGSTPHTNFDQLLSDAEVALYCVKRDGRDGGAAVRGEHEPQRARAI